MAQPVNEVGTGWKTVPDDPNGGQKSGDQEERGSPKLTVASIR